MHYYHYHTILVSTLQLMIVSNHLLLGLNHQYQNSYGILQQHHTYQFQNNPNRYIQILIYHHKNYHYNKVLLFVVEDPDKMLLLLRVDKNMFYFQLHYHNKYQILNKLFLCLSALHHPHLS